MADEDVTELTEETNPTVDDFLYLIDDPAGTPLDRKVTLGNAVSKDGTWTPDLQFGGAKVDITYSVDTGYYTKIGNMVFVTGFIILTSKGSSSGAAQVFGLPFTVADDNAAYSPPSLLLRKIRFTGQYSGLVLKNDTAIALYETTEAGVLTDLDDTDFDNDSRIMMSAMYRAA